MNNIGIFYGSSSGNTENAAKQIQKAFGEDVARIFDVAKASKEDLEQFHNLILGTSTLGIGDLQDDFEEFLSTLQAADLDGKNVAIFGLGDQSMYSDSFVDGMGQIYDAIAEKGCRIVGQVPVDGYEYDESLAERDGMFIGLPLDYDNQDDLTGERIKAWQENLKKFFD